MIGLLADFCLWGDDDVPNDEAMREIAKQVEPIVILTRRANNRNDFRRLVCHDFPSFGINSNICIVWDQSGFPALTEVYKNVGDLRTKARCGATEDGSAGASGKSDANPGDSGKGGADPQTGVGHTQSGGDKLPKPSPRAGRSTVGTTS